MKRITDWVMKCLKGPHGLPIAVALAITVSAILLLSALSPTGGLGATSDATGGIFAQGYGPTIVITDPPDGALVGSSTNHISGTITAMSVASAQLRIQRDSKYWNGASWQDAEIWVTAMVSGSPGNFTYSYGSSGLFMAPYQYTVTARYTDASGYTQTSDPVTYHTTGHAPAVPGMSLWGGVTAALILSVLIVWLVRRRSLQREGAH